MDGVPLEILVVTFDRAADLRRTLAALARSPLASLPVTVLDDASTDDTPAVCAAAAAGLPRLRVVRHPRNLGGSGNVLRAIELAEAEYLWILADDDDLHLDRVDDVLDELRAGRADLLSVGAPGRDGWPAGTLTSARELVGAGRRFFFVSTFLPNSILRRAAIDDGAFAEGYGASGDHYPHFPVVRRLAERDAPVYVSRHAVVERRGRSRPASELEWLGGWLRCCAPIADRRLRRRAQLDVSPSRGRWVLHVGAAVALERLRPGGRPAQLTAEALVALDGAPRAVAAAAALAVGVLPRPLLRALLRVGERLTGTRLDEVEERPFQPSARAA